MNHLATLFFCVFLLQYSYAQDYKQYLNLSYPDIDSLVMVSYQKGDFKTSLLYMKAASDKAKNEFGTQDSIFAQYTSNVGFFYTQMEQNDLAIPYYNQAKDINEKVHGKEHPTYATILNNLAMLHEKKENFNKSISLLLEAKDINEKTVGREHPNYALALNNLGHINQRIGNYDKALGLLLQAKDINEKTLGREHPTYAVALHNLASLHLEMSNFNKALPLLLESLDINKKAYGKQHPRYATSLNLLARLHKKMGNYNKALPLLIQAKDIREKSSGKLNHPYATLVCNLALLYQNMGNYSKALPLYNQAKDIYEKVLGKEHSLLAGLLNNLAGCHSTMGNHSKALPLYNQVIDIYEKTLGRKHPIFAKTLNNMAILHQSMGNFDLAWEVLVLVNNSSASVSLSPSFDKTWSDSLNSASYATNEQLVITIRSLGTAFTLLQLDNSIVDANSKLILVTDLVFALLTRERNQTTNEKDKLRFLTQSSTWLQRNLKLLNPKDNRLKAFTLVDQNKSVLLFHATKSEAAYRVGNLPDSLALKDKKSLRKQSQLQAKLVEKRSKEEKDSLLNELNHVNQDIDDFVQMIKKQYPKYHKLKFQQADPKPEEVQALLNDNTALLEYLISDSVLHIFFVDKTQVQWLKSYVGKEELKKRIKALHGALSNYEMVIEDKKLAYQKYTKQAHWFYLNLVAPALKDKKHIQNLILVTDGDLGHLPFETFLVQEAPQQMTDFHQLHYLVNDFNVSYNFSATLWKDNVVATIPNNNGQIFAMAANYNLQLDSSMMDVRLPTDQWLRDALNPLPKAIKEVETLQEKYQGFFAFDMLASEKTVKEKVSDFAILHFATHGILNAKSPILSSLAFSEDNDSTESNFWQAHEISKIQLNANLVVLSACETGFGKFEKGNGIASLARAFMYAGASSLIVSLWQVNDYATSEIMKNLYENLDNSMKIDEALRQAKLQYMKTTKGIMAHPAFWSPFIQIGNTRPISIKKKGGILPWVIGGGLLLLVLGTFAISRRKKEVA